MAGWIEGLDGLTTLYSIPRVVIEGAGSGSFACILVLLPSGRAEAMHVRLVVRFAVSKHKAAHLICDPFEKDGSYAFIWYFHIAGFEGAPSPSLPTDPNSRNKLAAD